MSVESKFSLRWKRPSPAILLVIAIAVVALLIAVALPALVSPSFANQPQRLLFQVQVIDDQGVPIPDAKVFVGVASGKTDLEGYCRVAPEFLARGRKGFSGTCRLEGDLRVEAPGYSSWQRSLPDLFGRHYNYVDNGATLTHQVTVYR